MSNTLYVKPKDEAHQAMLVDHYEFLGYYVKIVDGRVQVSSKKPYKPKVKKDEEKRNGRPAREADSRPRDNRQAPKTR